MSCKARLFVYNCLFAFCYSIPPVQQQRDISEENTPHAPLPDDQIVYDFAQDGAVDSNLYAAVHKHPRQAPVEPDQSNKYRAFDEMPTSSAADSEQHYTVINKHTNKGNDRYTISSIQHLNSSYLFCPFLIKIPRLFNTETINRKFINPVYDIAVLRCFFL